jgi:hypothetical protein
LPRNGATTNYQQVCLTPLATDCRSFKSSRRRQERRSSLLHYHPWTWAAWAAWMLCSRSLTLKWWPLMRPCLSPTGPGKTSTPVTLVSVAALLTLFVWCLRVCHGLSSLLHVSSSVLYVMASLLRVVSSVQHGLSSLLHTYFKQRCS